MKAALLGRLQLSGFCAGGMLVWEQSRSLTGLDSKRRGLYVLFVLPSGTQTHSHGVKRRKPHQHALWGGGH